MNRILTVIAAITISISTLYAGGPVKTFNLENGLTVLFQQDNSNPIVTAQCFLKSGAINESLSQVGLAHFTQVLMMQGTTKRSAKQLAQDIENIGGNITSDIQHDYTNLGMAVVNKNFENAVEILSDVVKNPIFDKNEIEKERFNTTAAIKARQDSISNVANDAFDKEFYGKHPYGQSELGEKKTVKRFKQKDIASWHKKYYVAKNMLIVVVGNISQEDAKSVLEKYFGSLEVGELAKNVPEPNVPKTRAKAIKNKKFQQAFLMTGYPAPSYNSKEYPILKVINAIMGSRMTGRLFTELREKLSLAYVVNSAYPTRKELSRFFIYIGLDKKNLSLAKNRIKEMLLEISTVPVSDQELTDTKNYIKGTYLLDHQTVGKKAWYLGWWESIGKGYEYDDQYLNDLLAVTPKDIQETAKKIFSDPSVTVEVVPK